MLYLAGTYTDGNLFLLGWFSSDSPKGAAEKFARHVSVKRDKKKFSRGEYLVSVVPVPDEAGVLRDEDDHDSPMEHFRYTLVVGSDFRTEIHEEEEEPPKKRGGRRKSS